MMNCVPDSVDNHDRQMILWLQMVCIRNENSQMFNNKFIFKILTKHTYYISKKYKFSKKYYKLEQVIELCNMF